MILKNLKETEKISAIKISELKSYWWYTKHKVYALYINKIILALHSTRKFFFRKKCNYVALKSISIFYFENSIQKLKQ